MHETFIASAKEGFDVAKGLLPDRAAKLIESMQSQGVDSFAALVAQAAGVVAATAVCYQFFG